MRLFKFLIGLLLIPACIIAGMALVELITALHNTSGDGLSRSQWWLISGVALWPIIHVTLPKSFSLYVLAHELSHAAVAFAMGANVHGFKVTENKGGYVKLSHSNFMITLAPYIVPMYAFCALAIYGLCVLFYDQRFLQPFWLGTLGLLWSYHITFTLWAISQEQTDIKEEGRLFSYTFIVLMNLLTVSLFIIAVSPPTLEFWINSLGNANGQLVEWVRSLMEEQKSAQ
jgi:hypothetical protein